MRKFVFFALFAVSAIVAMAQTNPKSGYVITNTGDTIRGTIDFRTNEKLSKQCDFWVSNGKTTYKPGDIEGFRFDDGGKYFVSRRLNVTGNPELYFAEFMVQGKMNLYCVTYNGDEYYFFEREDGEMAELTNRNISYATIDAANQGTKEIILEKQKQYGKVKLLLQQSKNAMIEMDDNNMTRKKLVNVVRDYQKDVCTDGSSCIVYEYNEKTDKIKAHFKVLASYAHHATEKSGSQLFPEINYSGNAFEIGVGVDIDLERTMKGLSIDLGLALTPKYKSSSEIEETEYPSPLEFEKSILNIFFGAAKRFGNGKIQPLVRGGGFVMHPFNGKETRYYGRSKIPGTSNDCGSTHYGIYVGGGIQMPIGKHYARLHADLYQSLELKKFGEMTRIGVTAEFAF